MLDVSNMIDERIESSIFRAVVTTIGADYVRIKRVGATVEDGQDYAAVDIYPFPEVDDEVLVLRLGKGYTVLGRLVRSGLDVLHTKLGDLEITGSLTLGPGGSIVDADGSTWDQDGIHLVASGILGENIDVTRAGSEGKMQLVSYIADTLLGDASTSTYVALNGLAYVSSLYGGGQVEFYGEGFAGVDNAYAGIGVVEDNGVGPAAYMNFFGKRVIVLSFGAASPLDGTAVHGGGRGVIFIANRTTAPTSNPTAGGILYAASGAGTWRGSSGTVTTFGPAEPHCPNCGRDFAWEWQNEKYGHLTICAWCFTEGATQGIMKREPK